MKRKISIVSPCYNEEENIIPVYEEISKIMRNKLDKYEYEIIFIDNYSIDRTREIILGLCDKDNRVKAIFNAKNFGHIRSPFYGLMQATGDAVILIASDLQDPPGLIEEFLEKWEAGNKIVIAVKNKSEEKFLMRLFRNMYYKFTKKMSDVELVEHFTGYGIYDSAFIKILREVKDPYPYFRGLIAEIGYHYEVVYFTQPQRIRGITKNNFYTLYDMAMLGITSHSKVPLRIATMIGFLMSGISLIIAFAYLIIKIIFWNYFPLGLAPIMIGLFFFSSVQLFFIGLLGEYILSINTRTLNRPLVVEEKRINF